MTTTNATVTMTTTNATVISEDYEYYDIDYVRMTLPVQLPTAIGLALLIVFAVSGNVLTIAAYVSNKKPRNIYDFYILILAIADLLISGVSMPFYAVYTLMEFVWPFGYAFCKAWLVADFTFCFQSILLMLLLSLDRLLMLTMGPYYFIKMTIKVAKVQILISWVVSFLVYGPAILGWNHWVGFSTVEENDCDVEFAYDFQFIASTSVMEFVLPFICLSSMNVVIYLKIRKRQSVQPGMSMKASVSQTASGDNTMSKPSHVTSSVDKPQSANNDVPTTSFHNPMTVEDLERKEMSEQRHSRNRTKREMKAARFLSILVIAFLLLWAPYTITTMAIAFCGDKCLNTSWYEFFNWLLWIKSAVNPLLYALNSSFYRNYFKRSLSCNGQIYRCLNRSTVHPT